VAGTVIAIIVCALSPLIASYYQDTRLVGVTCFLAANFVFGGLMVQHQALLTRQLKLGHTSVVRLSSSLISTVAAIVLAWMDFGYWALVWRELFRGILLTAGMWLCFRWIPALPSWKTSVRGMIGFGTNLTVANILASVTAGMDRFLLGRLWGPAPVAVYRQAYQLIVSPTDQLVSPLYNVAQPALCMLQNDGPRFRRYYQKVLLAVCIATMPLSLFTAVYATEITRIVLGSNWMGCSPVLMILALGTFLRQASGSSAYVLVARGGSSAYLKLTLLNNVIFVVSAFIGARWGVLGVAIADVATVWIMLAPRLYFSFLNSPVTLAHFFSTAARPACASVIMSCILMGLKALVPHLSVGFTLALGCFGALVGFAVAWLLIPGGKAEFWNIISDLKAVVRRKSSNAMAREVSIGTS